VGFEAIARGPIRVAGEAFVIEELEPVADAVLAHWMDRHAADVGHSFRAPGEPLARLGVVTGVVSDRLFRIRPGVPLLPVDDKRVHDVVSAVSLDRRITAEAFDFHGLLL